MHVLQLTINGSQERSGKKSLIHLWLRPVPPLILTHIPIRMERKVMVPSDNTRELGELISPWRTEPEIYTFSLDVGVRKAIVQLHAHLSVFRCVSNHHHGAIHRQVVRERRA